MILAGSMLLTGFGLGSKNVELKSEKALINLDVMVKDSLPGKYGNPEAGLSGKTEDMLAEGEDAKKEAKDSGKDAGTAKASEIRIVIHDRSITVNGKACKDVKEAADMVKSLYKVGLMVFLVDDYAEYQTYSQMYNIIEAGQYSVVRVTNE